MFEQGKLISQEIIDSVKDIDLIAYLESRGERFKKEGAYCRHIEHDSLVICGNSFSWNSRNKHGYGAILFNQVFYGMSFRESVQTLLDIQGILTSSRTSPQKKKTPFRYPFEQESQQIAAIKEYLTQERKIDECIVDYCIKNELIAQDKRKNLIFKWKDSKGKVIGAEKQGTVSVKNGKNTYKYVFPNDDPYAGFRLDIGKPEYILFFESPVDALSYWTLNRDLENVRMQSMSGLKHRTLLKSVKTAIKEDGLNIKGIKICVDNDDAGKKFRDYIKSITINDSFCTSDLPKEEGFDWNNVLQSKS